ncbi:DUF1735 domain-containing protein [Plebeiibacterium sediminum]|uniref:DUF1735 domain-containing protein n=1 Tax=Plebeiibacterium sediminum TaxID=2992112 RepID=A0AAE3SFL6_9BACT|nr:DUF1735 domain-containing protein [Plebeiobacterium sediminum]MCW3786318.1 DUF1735 domain-containing protein [Plebeiobacterium sediminum]
MRYIILFLLLVCVLSGCYDEYRLDYPYSTVAFSNATGGMDIEGVLARTVVKDEGMKLDIGVYLGGILENNSNRWVEYEIDESILDGTDFELLPSNYYTLSNTEKFEIPSGDYIGRVTLSLDSAAFVNDTKALEYKYALPIRLIRTSEDSILSTKSTQILTLKYINHYEGFYNHKGSFTTYSSSDEELNAGSFENVITASTYDLDTILINGLLNGIGEDYMAKLMVDQSNSIYMEYVPKVPEMIVEENVALSSTSTTSSVSDWENLDAIHDGQEPSNSETKSEGGAYGNWPNAETWNWVQYDFPQYYEISKSEVYWWTDNGGILIPYNSYVEYWDSETEEWKLLSDPVINGEVVPAEDYGNKEKFSGDTPALGGEKDMFNVTTFKPVITDKIRLHFIAVESQGIHEWKVWGIKSKLSGYEQEPIEKITMLDGNSFDKESNTFNLNYRINYIGKDHYTDVSSSMVWRNRIRDGVNEWRR